MKPQYWPYLISLKVALYKLLHGVNSFILKIDIILWKCLQRKIDCKCGIL
jgi:hypothetical protein